MKKERISADIWGEWRVTYGENGYIYSDLELKESIGEKEPAEQRQLRMFRRPFL